MTPGGVSKRIASLLLIWLFPTVTALGQEADDLPPPAPPVVAGNAATTVQLPTFGVAIDAAGVLRLKAVADPGGRLHAQRIAAARGRLEQGFVRGVGMRKVSLNRLEAALRRQLDAGEPVDESILNLAGLQRLQFVCLLPDSHDIVIAGPAEGWVADGTGRPVGVTSGRPVLQLRHLVVALRAFPPNGRDQPFVGCTIDPPAEGLARLQQFQRTIPHVIPQRDRARAAQQIAAGLRESLGMARIRVFGISPKTDFAQVLIEADYRMKLIGIGLEPPPVRMATFLGALRSVNESALQRWWFVPNYQCVKLSEDRLAMELVGQGVQLLGEDKVIGPNGKLLNSQSRPNQAGQLFTASFTARYPEIASISPVYAQMRNLIDMLVAAAFLQQQDYYGQANWHAAVLRDERMFATETHPEPQAVACAVNSIWKGSRLFSPAGGGVSIQPHRALQPDQLLLDEDGNLSRRRQRVLKTILNDRWWWD